MGLKFRKLWDIFFCYILFKTWLVKTFYTTWYCTRQDRKQKQHIFEEPLMYQKLCIYMQAQNSFRSDMLKPSNPRERNMQNISRRYDSFLQFQGNLLKIYISILITSSKYWQCVLCFVILLLKISHDGILWCLETFIHSQSFCKYHITIYYIQNCKNWDAVHLFVVVLVWPLSAHIHFIA